MVEGFRIKTRKRFTIDGPLPKSVAEKRVKKGNGRGNVERYYQSRS